MLTSIKGRHFQRAGIWIVTVVLLLAAGFKFTRQDMALRAFQPNDFRNVCFGSLAWVKGEQPYDPNVILCEMKSGDKTTYIKGLHSGSIVNAVYPPASFLLVSPFTALTWNTAVDVELTMCVAAYLSLIWIFCQRLPQERWIYFGAFALAYAPFHGAFQLGNISALVIPLLYIAVIEIDERPVAAAILLVIATCMKPQSGALLCAHLLLSRRWKPFLITSFTGILLSVVGAVRLHLAGLEWLRAYHNIIALQVSPYGSNENA